MQDHPARHSRPFFDCVALGEVMLRLDPGEGRIHTTDGFRVWEGGGEYNVARGLASCFRMRSAVVTALVDNSIGHLLERLIVQSRVDPGFIVWRQFDGIGDSCRNGLNFTERGFGIRSAVGVNDRSNTAASQLKPGDVDWEQVFVEKGSRWFHVGGIFSALSESTAELCLEGCRAAQAAGVTVSCDLNYRSSIWKRAGFKKAETVAHLRSIVAASDVLIGGKYDFENCLGIVYPENSDKCGPLASLEMSADLLRKSFPRLKVIASTRRKVKTASVNDWGALAWSEGKFYESRVYEHLDILDRVGGGDGFASGLIYGLLETDDIRQALEMGVAHGALVMTTPGDTSMATLEEVRNVVNQSGFSISR